MACRDEAQAKTGGAISIAFRFLPFFVMAGLVRHRGFFLFPYCGSGPAMTIRGRMRSSPPLEGWPKAGVVRVFRIIMWARTTSRRSTPYSSTGGEPGPRKRGILSDILILVIPFASGPAKNESFLWVISWRRGTARSARG